jgi:hypothetical protein
MKQLRSYQVKLRDFLDLHVRLVRGQGRQYLFDGKSLQGITNLEGVFEGGVRSNSLKSGFPHDATELSHTPSSNCLSVSLLSLILWSIHPEK